MNKITDSFNNVFQKLKIDNHKKKIYAAFIVKWVKIFFRTLFLLGMAYVLLYPIVYMLSNSLMSDFDRLDPTVVWIPKQATLGHYVSAIQALDYWNTLLRTVEIMGPSIILQIFSCMVVGYGFARFKFKGRGLLFSLLIFTIIVPAQTIIIPLFVNFHYFWGLGKVLGTALVGDSAAFNLIDTPFTFYLSSLFGMGIRSGLYIFIFRQFFRNMPKELEEAALIDGCGPFKVFRKIMVPNASSAIITVSLFSLVWHWNDYYLSNMYFTSNFPISVVLTMIGDRLSNVTSYVGEFNVAIMPITNAACMLTILPLLIIYIITQKYFTEGIEKTGLVG